LHGTTGSGTGLLTPTFAGELFGPGQPLDATKYFIILPDSLGHGKTAKPSDGLRAKVPQYDYDDIVVAQYRLVTEGLGVRHARMVLGFSMGGMNAWLVGGEVFRIHGRASADGIATHRNVEPQLDDASVNH
jgi:homoserine O-acetyltransferase/O-succinyltransferase